MKVFVTGGGGFLGLAIVEQLLQQGYKVVTFSRSDYPALQELGVEHHRGHLADYEAVSTAMQGCDGVFHVAAKVAMWGSYDSFFDTNVVGTRNIMRACREHGITKLVFTSSPSVVFSEGCEGADESLPYPEQYDAFYPQTKAIAEQEVLAANSADLHTCALRPHLVWGPKDHHFLPVLFEKRRKNRLRLVGKEDHLVDIIYIDNAAQAHLQAFEQLCNDPSQVAGKAYFLSQDQPITIRDFLNRLIDSGGLPPVESTVNRSLALGAAWFFETIYKTFGIMSEPPVTRFVVKHMSAPHWYDISAAKRDFGYTPSISIDEGMKRLKKWVQQSGQGLRN